MSNPSQYIKAAEKLKRNPGQWAAYESKGHCVVLAGPGSGKTKTLTLKLARLLAEDVEEPRGIACITYNNECARELENKLEVLGIQPGGRVFIGTVHSFSLTQIVLPYEKAAGLSLPEEFSVASRQERAIALERAFHKTIGGPDNPHNWEFIMGRHRRSILNRQSAKWKTIDPQLSALVEAYEQELRGLGRIDFDDMPLLAVRALRENPWLRQALLAKYPVLVIDEYQDLGQALHNMVMGLCFKVGIRLFAVGDVDQSIYGFIGAKPELLQNLSDRTDVETVRLRLNYRCGSNIVEASCYALGEDRDYEAAEDAAEGTIYFHACKEQGYEQQSDYLFSTVLPEAMNRIPETSFKDIAVLYPAAWIGNYVNEAAQYYNISTIRTDGNALYPRSSRIMRWLELCAQWCCGGWRTGSTRFSKVSGEGWRLFAEVLNSPDAKFEFQRQLIGILWERRDNSISISQWLLDLRNLIIDELIGECRTLHDESDILNDFVARISPGGDCEDMLLRQFAGQGDGSDCITLSTLHSSKGREFSIVVMFAMDGGRIPRSNIVEKEIVEARRLFYVGFTRAKKELHIMYSSCRPSPFVYEVKKRLTR